MSEEPHASSQIQRALKPEFLTHTKFEEFNLPPPVLSGLKDAGFTYCTPIQAQTLPVLLTGRDVAGPGVGLGLLLPLHRLEIVDDDGDKEVHDHEDGKNHEAHVEDCHWSGGRGRYHRDRYSRTDHPCGHQ